MIFFASATTEWNKLDCYISNADSFEVSASKKAAQFKID